MSDEIKELLINNGAKLEQLFTKVTNIDERLQSVENVTLNSASDNVYQADNVGDNQERFYVSPAVDRVNFVQQGSLLGTVGSSPLGSTETVSPEDIKNEFKTIKDSFSKVHLPANIRLTAERTGVKWEDLLRLNVISNCALYSKTVLKIGFDARGVCSSK